MSTWQRPKAMVQLATYLRGELAQGRWAGRMPGVIRLAKELGAARNTVEGALKLLEHDGFLLPQGHGKGRVIRPGAVGMSKKLRVGFLPHDPVAQIESHIIELQHELQGAGFSVVLADKSLKDVRMSLQSVKSLVRKANTAAWVISSASGEILNWFIEEGIPAYALFGRRRDLPIAGGGPDKTDVYRQAARELMARGHRRIILLTQRARRLPEPDLPERSFLEELKANGISTSPYNLPDWEPNPEGLVHLLNECYRLTPPTAFLIDESYLFHAVKHQLAWRGIRCPHDVSLICTDPDHSFDWCRPTIAHMRWDNRQLIRHAARWANSVRQGKELHDQLNVPAELVLGETIGQAHA